MTYPIRLNDQEKPLQEMMPPMLTPKRELSGQSSISWSLTFYPWSLIREIPKWFFGSISEKCLFLSAKIADFLLPCKLFYKYFGSFK